MEEKVYLPKEVNPTKGLLVSVLVLLSVPLLYCLGSSPSGEVTRKKGGSATSRILVAKSTGAFCAGSERDLNLLLRAVKMDDGRAFSSLLKSERVFYLAQNTEALWLHQGESGIAKVRVLGGSAVGQECFIVESTMAQR